MAASEDLFAASEREFLKKVDYEEDYIYDAGSADGGSLRE